MIPEAGLLTFSVDKAPYSILMMVSIVSAYRLMARRGVSDSFFLIRIFFMRGADYYITRKHQKPKGSTQTELGSSSCWLHFHFNSFIKTLWFCTLGQGLKREENLTRKKLDLEPIHIAFGLSRLCCD